MAEKNEVSAQKVSSEHRTAPEFDPFLMDRLYPEPAEAFLFQPKTLAEIKDTATIFLDTNVLLLPYNTGKNSLTLIEKVYAELVRQNRLFIPARVMQEFMKNAPERLKDSFQNIHRQRNININVDKFPLFENIPAYDELIKVRVELLEKVKNFQKAVGNVIDVIKDWHHDDPVRRLYCKVFTPGQFVSLEKFDPAEFKRDLDFRYQHKIPPGYKDSAKQDDGVGDLLIWKTILQVGMQNKCDAIFVCGEEKADWWHRSEKQTLVVRLELVEEYRRVSGGKTFRLIDIADFLELFGATEDVVEEVKVGQDIVSVLSTPRNEESLWAMTAEIAVGHWITNNFGTALPSPLGFDYEAQTSTGLHLFEVKTMSARTDSSRRIRDIRVRMERLLASGTSIDRGTLVFVAEDRDLAFEASFRRKQWASFLPQWFDVVIGYLDGSGRFKTVQILD